MRSLHPSLQTVRPALVAALVALAVAAPATFVLQHFLHRPVVEAAAPARLPVAATASSRASRPSGKQPKRPVKAPPALPGPGLPGSLSVSLKASPVVVVGLYTAGDTIDMSANTEAEAGASLAKVPYVPVNVGDESQIGDLAARLPNLAVPSVVIFGRGGRVLAQFNGYADRQAVAEAVDALRPH